MKVFGLVAMVALVGCGGGGEEDTSATQPEGELLGGMEFIAVEAQTFEMGSHYSDVDRADDELLHTVVLTGAYEMGRTEVTAEQFLAYAGYDPVQVNVGCMDCPVQNVSWHEAAAFTNMMNDFHGLETCYTCEGEGIDVQCELDGSPYECDGYRLPTEAEWEYGSKAGEDTKYPGSDDPTEVGWYWDTSDHHTEPVGLLKPNAWGFVDMGGNVREFVNDWYGDYRPGTNVDPWVGVIEGGRPIERGASYDCIPRHMRVVTRYFHMNSDTVHPENGQGEDRLYVRDAHVGFRLARSIR